MDRFRDFQIEQISFWAGLITATLIWWIISTVRKNWSRIKSWIKSQYDAYLERRLAGAELFLRESTYKRSQESHLAAPLFPLDDLAIEPLILVPPTKILLEETPSEDTIIQKIIPYIPDYPDLLSHIGYPSMSLSNTLANPIQLVLIGDPGSGKSFALADLASKLARRATGNSALEHSVPLYCHFYDLNLENMVSASPETPLFQAIKSYCPTLVGKQLEKYLHHVLLNNSAVLILDGLDELHPSEWEPAIRFLKYLLQKYPDLRIITTANPNRLGGLLDLGFIPAPLKSWGMQQHTLFMEKWQELWTTRITPQLPADMEPKPDPVLLNSIISSLSEHQSPLDWTLLIWGAYAGDLDGTNPLSGIQTFITRSTSAIGKEDVLGAIGQQFIITQKGALPHDTLAKLLSKFKLVESPSEATPSNIRRTKTKKLSAIDQTILSLMDAKILMEYANGVIGFSNPMIGGYLAALLSTDNPIPHQDPSIQWSLLDAAETFWAYSANIALVAQNHLQLDVPPLHAQFLKIGKTLRSVPRSEEWRINYMRRMVQLITQEALPMGIRLKILTTALRSNDPSIPALLKQLSNNNSPVVRQVIALGCGYYQEGQLIDILLALLGDSDADVRLAACIAISSIESEQALAVLEQILSNGDEPMRLAVAEALAFHPPAGHDILQRSMDSEDILTRRAVVFGLAEIDQEWAKQALEKIAIGDAQWIVRNAAAQVLEKREHSSESVNLTRLVKISDSPWLIQYAGEQGEGIANEDHAQRLLIQALRYGQPNDVLNALSYLPTTSTKEGWDECSRIANGPQSPMREAATYALWLMFTNQSQ